MGGPLKLKFANHFIIYQNCPLRGHFGTGRLHSQLWDWGVKTISDCLVHSTDQCYECCHKKMCGGIEKIGCDVIAKSEMEQLIEKEIKLIKNNAKDRDIFMCAPQLATLGMTKGNS